MGTNLAKQAGLVVLCLLLRRSPTSNREEMENYGREVEQRASIAADVAARYGVPCRPEAVQFIPRGVSGLPDPLAPVPLEESRKRYMAAHYAGNSNRARAARLRRAEEAVEQAAKPKREVMAPEERAARDKARKADARHAAAAATAERIRAMADRQVEEIAAALGFTVPGTKRLAIKLGVAIAAPVKREKLSRKVRDKTAVLAAFTESREIANAARKAKGEARRAKLWALADGVRTRAEIAALTGEEPGFVRKAMVGYVVAQAPVAKRPGLTPRIQDGLNEGLTVRQISARLECAVSTISWHISTFKLTRPAKPALAKRLRPKPGPAKETAAEREAMRAKVAEEAKRGGTMVQIAEVLGISRQSVQRHINALGLTGRKISRTSDRDAEIIADSRAGMAYRAIAAKYGIAKSNVHRIVMRGCAERPADARKPAGQPCAASGAVAPVLEGGEA
jgi:DNA-binding CsgD family transcriptional regulator